MPEAMARNGSGLRARASRLARPAANLVYGRYRHEAEVQRVRKHPSQPAPPVTQASTDAGQCSVVDWLRNADAEIADPGVGSGFEIARFPVRVLWAGDGYRWEKA